MNDLQKELQQAKRDRIECEQAPKEKRGTLFMIIPNEITEWLEKDDVRSLKISVIMYASAWNLRLEDARTEYGITMNILMSTPDATVTDQLRLMVKQMEKHQR